VRAALGGLPAEERESAPVLLTAHSLPQSVVDKEPGYLDQIMETVRAVAERAGLGPERWSFAYQSAGHSPEPWLTPDMKDLLPGLAEAGHKNVLMVPVQFVADHLETLYDIDVAAREEAEEVGMGFHRIEMFNVAPDFIGVLANVVRREEADLRQGIQTGEEPQASREILDRRR
jgi:ferrochelatase